MSELTARLSLGGPLWGWKGWPDVYTAQTVHFDPHREHITFDPFTCCGRVSPLNVEPGHERVEIRDAANAAPHVQAQDPRAVDLLLDAFSAITSDYERAVPVCRAAVDRLHSDMSSPSAELRWFWHGTVLALELWDDQGAYSLSSHHSRVARSTGALSQLALALSSHTPVLVFRGDIAAAQYAVGEAEAVQEATGVQAAPYGALIVSGWQGLEQPTKHLVDVTVRDATVRGEGMGIAIAEYARAVVCNGLGQYGEALGAATGATADSAELVAHNWGLGELVEAGVRSGHRDVAQQAYRRLARKTQATGTQWADGIEARCRALVSAGDEAEDAYRESIAHLDRASVRAELARTHLVYGEWLRRANRRLEARQELTIAHDSLSSMGLAAFAERARGELLATGATVRKRTIDLQHVLTPQEGQIARLARDGLSNIEIGSQLFLSARTIEWHLRKVFRKLEIRSLRQLRISLQVHA